MIEVSYFATGKLYVVEVVDREGPEDIIPELLDDRRVYGPGDQRVLAEIARQEAVELASRYGVSPARITYDEEGETTEARLFG